MSVELPPAMAELIDSYFADKPADDVDLVFEIRKLLVDAGISEDLIKAAYDNNKHVAEAAGKLSEVQRTLLNRYWQIQLRSASELSTDVRYYLIPNGIVYDWLRMFSDHILPFVLRNSLPTVI